MNVLDFFEKYELICNVGDETISKDEPLNRVCRFCKRNERVTSFKNQAHIVPELLGQNDYICFDECDECNRLFSKYENHLAIFLRPYLAIMGIRTKNGVPTFESRTDGNEEKRTRFTFDSDGNRLLEIGDLDDIRTDATGHTISVRFRLPPYRHSDMFRSLLKIGLSLMPQNCLDNYHNCIDWLLNKTATVNRIQALAVTVLTTTKFGTPNVFLYKKKEEFSHRVQMPEFTLIVGTANLMLQIFLPYSDAMNDINGINSKPEATIFPAIGYERQITKTRAYTFFKDLIMDETVKEDEWLTFTSSTPLTILKRIS